VEAREGGQRAISGEGKKNTLWRYIGTHVVRTVRKRVGHGTGVT
jgi:hypothetical protein